MKLIKVLFFARVRDQLGTSELNLELPAGYQNVGKVLALLRQKSETFDEVLADPAILVALNQEIASPEATVEEGDELALFPPVTGG